MNAPDPGTRCESCHDFLMASAPLACEMCGDACCRECIVTDVPGAPLGSELCPDCATELVDPTDPRDYEPLELAR